MENNKLQGKIIWITGASRGIGLATAKILSKNGATVVLSASSSKSFDMNNDFFKSTPKVFLMPCDVADELQVINTEQKISNLLGTVDILINNAGKAKFAKFVELTLDDFAEMFNVNTLGVFNCTKAVLPKMLEKQSGIIINILSVAARKVFLNSSVYSASKAAVAAMSATIREEVRSQNIKVIDVFPGATKTDIWTPELLEKFAELMIPAEEIADAIYNTIKLSLENNFLIEEIVIRPQNGDLK